MTCSEEQRVTRFAARQKIDLEAARKEVMRRMAAQLPDEEKIKAADYVIDNSGRWSRRESERTRCGKTFSPTRKAPKAIFQSHVNCHP